MVRPTRKKQIQNLQEVIKETAWNQIARKARQPYPCVQLRVN